MLFITSNFYNWVCKLISEPDCTICFLGMCSAITIYILSWVFFFFVNLFSLLKWLNPTYCCFIVQSYSTPSASASLLGIKSTWEEGNIKQNLILSFFLHKCAWFIFLGQLLLENAAEFAGRKGKNRNSPWGGSRRRRSRLPWSLSPGSRDGTGWEGSWLLVWQQKFWFWGNLWSRAGLMLLPCWGVFPTSELSDSPWWIFPLIFLLNSPSLILILLFLFAH